MASVTYKIGGKYDGKAVKQAQSGFSSLKGTIANLKGVISGLAIVGALKKVADYSKECTDAFAVQQKAISQLSVAVSNNKNLTQQSLNNLIGYTGKLQSKSVYGDEVLQGQTTYLAGLGLQEDQIKSVLEASVELSSAGVGTLDSNVQNLAKTLNGTSGKLGQLIPEFQDLTAEQLKNGEAIEIVKRKYQGFAENLSSNTLEGVTKQVSNLVGDIKEKLGSVSGTLKFEGMKRIIPVLEKINVWLDQNVNKITNLFLNLPEVGGLALNLLKQMAQKLFSIDGLKQYFTIVGKLLITIMKNSLLILFNVVVAVGETIWQPLKTGFEWVGYGIKLAFTTVVNFFIEKINALVDGFVESINWIIDKINTIREFFGQDKLQMISGVSQIEVKQAPTKPLQVDTKKITDAWKNVGTSFTDGTKEIIAQYKETGTELAEMFGDEFSEFGKNIDEVMNRPIKVMGTGSLNGENAEVTNSNSSPDSASKGLGAMSSFLSMLGQLGQVIQAIMSSNWIGLLIQFLGALSSSLADQSESWNKLLNCMSTIADVVAEIIGGVFEEIFKPFADGLESIGKIIGSLLLPILQVISSIITPMNEALTEILNVVAEVIQELSPIVGLFLKLLSIFSGLTPIMRILSGALKVLAEIFKFLYNSIIVPIGNAILKVFITIANFFIKIWQKIYDVLDWISLPVGIDISWSGISVKWKSLASMLGAKRGSTLDYDDYSLSRIEDKDTEEDQKEKDKTKTGASASYTAVRDINQTFNIGYVVGQDGFRQFALLIRDEIRSAEKLGR